MNRAAARRSAGFALILALFLIVSLSAIAAYLLTTSTGQLAAVTQDEQGARAYQAARTGIELLAYRVLRDAAYADSCAAAPQTQTLTFPASGLGGFSVTVRCESTGSETENGATLRMYRITSTGCNCPSASAGDATYVERQLELTLAN